MMLVTGRLCARHSRSVATVLIAFSFAALLAGCAETRPGAERVAAETPREREQRLAWWRDARFGLFIHWGPVSLKGTEIGWSRGGERRGRTGAGQVPAEEYDNLYKEFNPVRFNADEWVRVAKDAGMKYLVFTTKHHDGFVNFDSKLTDYKITSKESPFGRDIVRELADACRRAGMRLGFYYSPPDWHHPDYRRERHAEYIEYMHGQLRELCTNYGRVDIIWFDGLGGTAADWDSDRMHAMIRQLQPHVIINNRGGLEADYDTPEQTIGSFQRQRPWETCMTIGQQWAWKPNDEIKSLKKCLQTLVRVAGGDGNFLFNVGPMPDGRIEPQQVERLREMGDWLKQYGESIYGTRGGPYRWNLCEEAPVVATCKGNRVYVHVLEWQEESLWLPKLPGRIRGATVLTGGSVSVMEEVDGLRISVPTAYRDEIDTIIAIELDRDAENIAPIGISAGETLKVVRSEASNVYSNQEEFGPSKAFDNEVATRWATDAGTHEAWIIADFGKPVSVTGMAVCEALSGRVEAFEIQYDADGEWKTIHTGKRIGNRTIVDVQPVTAQRFRLNITKAREGPTLTEIQFRGPE